MVLLPSLHCPHFFALPTAGLHHHLCIFISTSAAAQRSQKGWLSPAYPPPPPKTQWWTSSLEITQCQRFVTSHKPFLALRSCFLVSNKEIHWPLRNPVCKGRTGVQPLFYMLPMWKTVAQLQSCMKWDESMVNCSLGTGGKNIVQWRQAGDSIIYLAISESQASFLTRGYDYWRNHTPKHSSSQHT